MSLEPTPESSETLRYQEALTELETILNAIEKDEVDIDDLAHKVERAAHLLTVCRDKIEHTEMQVRRIIDTLDPNAVS